MWHRSSTSSVHLVVLLVLSNAFVGVRAVFTGTPVFLRWARVEETAALFANNTPNTEIFHEPIQKAAEQALVKRMDNTLRVSNEREWAPPVALVNRTLYYSVALDYFAKQAAAREQGEAYWIRSPGKKNFLLVDKSPQHISLNRVFRTAAVLATASVFTRPRDPNTANRYQYEATAMLHPIFLANDSMLPDMTWAAAIPKDAPENPDSLQTNPNGFMELNDLPLMLDIVSLLQVDNDRSNHLRQWLLCASKSCPLCLLEYKSWLMAWRGRNIERFSPEGELSMKLQLATITHYLGQISEYNTHCFGTEDIFRSWIDLDGHLTTMIPAGSEKESTLETLSALTSLALVCAASTTDLFHLPAPSADATTRPLLALAAKRAADEFSGQHLYLPTDTVWPTRGAPYGLSFYAATETLPALFQAYKQKEVAYFMKSLVADNESEHRSGRALVSSLRHVSPTSPENLVFLAATANSGDFSCEAREALNLAQCKAKEFMHTKAGVAVVALMCLILAGGLCMAIRWRRGQLAREDSMPESLPSPHGQAGAHVKVTLKENMKRRSTGDKGSDCNSGSHMGSVGARSDTRISALPAGATGPGVAGSYVGVPQPHAWRNNPMRTSDSSFIASSRQSIQGSPIHAVGGTSSIGPGGSSFMQQGSCMAPSLQWAPNGGTMTMHAPHASKGIYSNPVAVHRQSSSRMHGTYGAPLVPFNQSSTAPMQQGYGTAVTAHGQQVDTRYYSNLGVFLPSRRSRSRTPPRGRGSRCPQNGAPGATHLSPRNKKRNSQSRDQLMESLTAFQKVTHETKSSSSRSWKEPNTKKGATPASEASKDSAGGTDDKIAAVGVCMADATHVNQECSVDDVPMHPPHAMLMEGSDSTVVRNGSLSFSLPGASNNTSVPTKLQALAPAADAESSFATCATHTTFATAIGVIAEERSRDIAGGASSFFRECNEQSEAVLSVSPSKLQLSGGEDHREAARSRRSGMDVVSTRDFEDDASVLSASSVMVPQNHKKLCKSPEGSGLDGSARFSLKSAHNSLSPGKVDTFTEAAPSVAFLQAKQPQLRTPPKSNRFVKASALASPVLSPDGVSGAVSDLDDAMSCMHMPPPPTGPIGGASGSGFFATAIMGGGGKSPERDGLAAMMPQVLQNFERDGNAEERRKRIRKIAAASNNARKAAQNEASSEATSARAAGTDSSSTDAYSTDLDSTMSPEKTQQAESSADADCSTQETAFAVAERAQQAREAMSGLLRKCYIKQ